MYVQHPLCATDMSLFGQVELVNAQEGRFSPRSEIEFHFRNCAICLRKMDIVNVLYTGYDVIVL